MATKLNQNGNVNDMFNDLIPDDFSGYTKPNGTVITSQSGLQTFVPADLPPSFEYDLDMIKLLTRAERTMGELKGRGYSLKNPHILLRIYLKREAVVSSRIEGTLASIDDLNKYEVLGIGKAFAERLRLHEVVNHVDALDWALDKIKNDKFRIDLDLIRKAHKILLGGVREQSPGEFRDQQNMIVKTGVRKSKIVYTPPPPNMIPNLLDQFEKFCIETHDDIPVLIQCAMIHYQFEAIHPFGDGNGRLGRLLVLLMLCKRGLLPEPLLYLSAFFDEHRDEYYNGLLEVSRKSAWVPWIKFFLQAFAIQSAEALDNIEKLVDLQEKYRRTLLDRNASGNAIALLEALFKNPYISIPVAQKILKVSYPAAKRTVHILVDEGILMPTDIPHRSKIFVALEIEVTLR